MKLTAKWIGVGLVVWLGAVALALPATAGVDDFKLTRAIPADATLAAHGRDHAGMAFLNEQYERVWKVVEQQHFERVVRMFLKGTFEAQGEDIEQFEQQWEQFSDLLLGVEWSSLAERESAFALKLGFPAPEMVFLGLSTPEKAKENFAGLEAILKMLADLAPPDDLVITTQGEGDSVVHTLGFANAPIPVGELMLAREKDVLLIGFGVTMPEQSLALLRGEPGKYLAGTDRFQAAMKRLPPPSDQLFFMDTARFMGQIRSWVEQMIAMQDPTGEMIDAEQKALPGKIIAQLDIFEYIASVATTDGLKTTGEGIALLRDDAQTKLFYGLLCGNGTLEKPLKFIPQDAQNFSVWSGINLRALYDGIMTFVHDEVPGGEDLIAELEVEMLELPFDIEEDVLNWVGGGISTFSMPGETAFKPGGSAFMLSVKDDEKAREMLGRLLAAVEPMLGEQGMIDDADIEGAEGFKVVVVPILAMIPGLGQPTLGVKDGQLFLGSSPKIVEAALNTAAGQRPNFATNERFLKEGLPLQSNVMSASFTDLTKMGEEIGQLLQMVPMIGMFAPEVAKNPVGRALITAAGKLGKVVREFNFLQSSCAQTTFDGRVMHTRMIFNYREPPKPETAPPAKEPTAGGEEEEPPALRG